MNKFMLLIMVCFFTLGVKAQTVQIGDLYYTLNADNTAEVSPMPEDVRYTFTSVVIPAEVKDNDVTYKVTKIGANALRNNDNLISVKLPSSVTTIGNSAFAQSGNLATVIGSEYVTVIEDWAFYGCWGLTSFVFSPNITAIPDYSFSNCGLKSVVIPGSVKKCGNQAFRSSKYLETIIFKEGVEEIDAWQFAECTALKTIKLPASITKMDDWAFDACPNIAEVYVAWPTAPEIGGDHSIKWWSFGDKADRSAAVCYVPAEYREGYGESWGDFPVQAYDVQKVNPVVDWTVIRSEDNWDLDMTAGGSLVWGDYNNDGYLDAFANMGNDRVHLYRNNEGLTFEKVQEGFFTGLKEGYAVFVDYNNDGYLDLVVTGKADALADAHMTIFYKNTGIDGEFAFEVDDLNSSVMPGMVSGDGDRVGHMLNAVDIDNDGWIDLVVNGNISETHPFATETGRFMAVYRNNKGVFEMQQDNVNGMNFVQMAGGSVHVGDFNGDGFPDIVNIGYADGGIGYTSALYQNNGDGTFTKLDYELDKNEKCDIVFADINGDGLDDMVEITGNVANIHISKGDGTFERWGSAVTGLHARQAANITVADVNNDGFVDIFTSVYGDNPSDFTKIYYNNGDNTFTEYAVSPGARPGTANLVDMNNDGNLDASYYGWGGDLWPNRFMRNDLAEGVNSNTAPTVPTNLNVSFADGMFVINWDKATDAETPQDAIRYNLYAKDKTTEMVYVYAPADLESGKLKIGGGIIPLIKNNSFEWNLPDGKYTFGVQAVDQANVASAFAKKDYPEGTDLDIVSVTENAVFSSNGNINISNKGNAAMSFDVLSINGQILKSGICQAGAQASVSGLAQGIYLVKVSQNGETRTVKISVFR